MCLIFEQWLDLIGWYVCLVTGLVEEESAPGAVPNDAPNRNSNEYDSSHSQTPASGESTVSSGGSGSNRQSMIGSLGSMEDIPTVRKLKFHKMQLLGQWRSNNPGNCNSFIEWNLSFSFLNLFSLSLSLSLSFSLSLSL